MLTRDELKHTDMLSLEEQAIVKWQFGLYGHFYTALFNSIKMADEHNLAKLAKAYPIEVGGFIKFKEQEGWWEGVGERLRELNEFLCEHGTAVEHEECAACATEKAEAQYEEVRHGDRDEPKTQR